MLSLGARARYLLRMESAWQDDWHLARAYLAWQAELGATDAICDAPVNRYDLPAKLEKPKPAPVAAAPLAEAPQPDPVADAQTMAQAAHDLDALQAAMAAFEHCELKRGARNLVFSDGMRGARVMIVGEAPGREEDRVGKPFVGDAGQMLDRMFAAIGQRRDQPDPKKALYITNILPWRPPQNRDPSTEERAMMRPFVLRHIELADPDILILMGRISASTLLERDVRITKERGEWTSVLGRPTIPMLHPAYLLRNPAAKRDAWADLLSLQAKLRELP
ncbi:MAG: family 4 uracil-DNA glycosylase [Roseibaca calidilacus]|uniref:Type-4 uracil-DNA glycosylase n=2 Tax=Roseibaca calidilacus TaxID=1666912 RepID=A0A0P7W392_9RHOB|nr:MAG: family 4 uracil-DNA glycosylase [Roseibaca calidilacus]CUX83453.1 DNA polymerase [Roseibaca calidilacus]